MTREKLEELRDVNLSCCEKQNLVDIRDITIDKTKSVSKRIADFIEAIGNPYLFRVDDVIVKVNYNPEGKSFLDAVTTVLSAN